MPPRTAALPNKLGGAISANVKANWRWRSHCAEMQHGKFIKQKENKSNTFLWNIDWSQARQPGNLNWYEPREAVSRCYLQCVGKSFLVEWTAEIRASLKNKIILAYKT
jgi:hypothetical protein